MPIHTQESHGTYSGFTYAYCARCGVCGPVRRSQQAAIADHDAHSIVCTGGAL